MTSFASLRDASGPSAAVEIAATRVAGATIEWRSGQPAVVAHAVESLPEGAVVASLTAGNVLDRAAVALAVTRVLEGLGKPRRIALVVPDPIAKVSLIKFERVAARPEDLDELVRWQVRKTAPFPIEEAQLSYVPGQLALDGQEFLVTLARRDVVAEYEQLVAYAGAHAGVVDLATFNIINAVLAGQSASAPEADWLLVNAAPDYVTLAILRGPHLIFFRNRAADTEGTLADVVHQTAMYYEDRLSGTGFTRVLLAGAGGDGRHADEVDLVRRSLEQRLTTTVDTIDPRLAVTLTDRITADPVFLDTLAPLVGVLLRGQEPGGKAA
jgi:Tfp pilus assembly PilM family ATPase